MAPLNRCRLSKNQSAAYILKCPLHAWISFFEEMCIDTLTCMWAHTHTERDICIFSIYRHLEEETGIYTYVD